MVPVSLFLNILGEYQPDQKHIGYVSHVSGRKPITVFDPTQGIIKSHWMPFGPVLKMLALIA